MPKMKPYGLPKNDADDFPKSFASFPGIISMNLENHANDF